MISEELVEATWRESASFSQAAIRRGFDRIAKRQPALLAFVLAESESLSRDGVELANYLFFVVARMFYTAAPRIRRISIRAIQKCADEVETRMTSLVGAHDRFLERAAIAVSSSQPHVFRYVIETLMEQPNADDPLQLTEDDKGGIFLILAAVINALDEKAVPQGTSSTPS
jgi:hypothetical protein